MKLLRRLVSILIVSGLFGCASADQQMNSGLWHYDAGLWGEAAPRLINSVPEIEKSNPNDPRLSTALIALGEMSAGSGRYDLSEDFFRRAVKVAEAQLPPDEVLIRNASVHTGYYYLGQNRPAEAAPLFTRAAKLSEKYSGDKRVLHAVDLDNIGVALTSQGLHKDGNEVSQRALRILDDLPLQKEVEKTRAVIFYNLAYSYVEQTRFAEAEDLYRKSLNTLAPIGAPLVGEQWRINVVLTNYSKLLRQLGRNDEAKVLEVRIK
ncbi:tetratricopeptide repeat protein [Geobacter pelophilus]|uniref:Tetratricopeptide repeat protein n=1 Tax=Geoanaerobacter pelophilus TaxID=60036 RepID=A0AAW4LC46_9BACT|nr:tetratricopeptide repeat protein [Geoanaerobacter pelophilus]MBT0665437.1 tetratricopeptide repeat protein [Geoanaerobacter pelophilus]